MHHAPLTSPRLQRVLAVLRDGRPHTTREIVRRAHVVAVNSCIAELRANGAEILCTRERKKDRLICRYTMMKAPE
ncbi:helix-turn-helix domain-containing protein [Roseovarius autotrophicus]|uniref:helix-turn-helix domain-containing protein n=1 Tax=Roseovarius autotrophicus TaxID=2824121 RepID=UPI001B37FC94|nr:helix-turn-helix domain-containing protein [Roseovarius autotrophicus]